MQPNWYSRAYAAGCSTVFQLPMQSPYSDLSKHRNQDIRSSRRSRSSLWCSARRRRVVLLPIHWLFLLSTRRNLHDFFHQVGIRATPDSLNPLPPSSGIIAVPSGQTGTIVLGRLQVEATGPNNVTRVGHSRQNPSPATTTRQSLQIPRSCLHRNRR